MLTLYTKIVKMVNRVTAEHEHVTILIVSTTAAVRHPMKTTDLFSGGSSKKQRDKVQSKRLF